MLLTVSQPFANHNGGMIAFGPDGFLYIALGDGGGGGDPGNRAQNPNVLLGKILRIDVDGRRPYAHPAGQPVRRRRRPAGDLALGLRNPWRFSFDRENGDGCYIGDVGQSRREEIDLGRHGRNYGWRMLEGTAASSRARAASARGLEPPRAEYGHRRGRCAVTGGYVYRGRALPALGGTYVFGDFCSGEIFGLRCGASGRCSWTPISRSARSARTRPASCTWSITVARFTGSRRHPSTIGYVLVHLPSPVAGRPRDTCTNPGSRSEVVVARLRPAVLPVEVGAHVRQWGFSASLAPARYASYPLGNRSRPPAGTTMRRHHGH